MVDCVKECVDIFPGTNRRQVAAGRGDEIGVAGAALQQLCDSIFHGVRISVAEKTCGIDVAHDDMLRSHPLDQVQQQPVEIVKVK